MGRSVTVVMYHYVRDLERSRFPSIKGLSVDRFRRQLEFIRSNFTPVSIDDVFGALTSKEEGLPEKAILLTFDDGYADHFTNVFPLLEQYRIRGCFFPVVRAAIERVVLDVNKIQFILATVPDVAVLLGESFAILDEFRGQYALKAREEYESIDVEKHRYDAREVIVFKRLLQRELPESLRTQIVRRLFAKYITADEASFSAELYMSREQLMCLARHGMHVGCHSYSHVWLNHVTRDDQAREVDSSLEFVKSLGAETQKWTMCYPYGGFNDSLIGVLSERHCSAAFCVEPRVANLDLDDPLKLPRIDTNDLPS